MPETFVAEQMRAKYPEEMYAFRKPEFKKLPREVGEWEV
jgi:hypothetical protein